MQWQGGEESSNVEDRRGMGGLGGGAAVGGGSILLVILGLIFGVDLGGFRGGDRQARAPQPGDEKTKKFFAVVLNYTEKVWDEQFRDPKNGYGRRYEKPKLVLFSDGVRTGCGDAPSSVGPFYCPRDETVYLDPTFFEELGSRKLGGSKAEFSQAYVVAHEVGHHVQNLLGFSALVDQHRGRRDEKQYSVRLELQADYLAGVWAYHGKTKFNFIEPGDVEEAIKSALAIGDDRLQKQSRGWASPESYTHGTSKQRSRYFTDGLKTGDATKARLDRFFSVGYDPRTGELAE